MRFIIQAITALCFLSVVHATFSDSFRSFLKQQYGAETEAQLSRLDLGVKGSVGGGVDGNVAKSPIIFVHGFLPPWIFGEKLQETLKKNDYTENEFFTTTYGQKTPASQVLEMIDNLESTATSFRLIKFFKDKTTSVSEWFASWFTKSKTPLADLRETIRKDAEATIWPVSMKCEYVKQVRTLIQAVSAYTNRKVSIIAHNIGGPISRKAILGGACVDEPETNLGQPLTDIVASYLSVGGAQQGAFACLRWLEKLPIVAPRLEICGPVTGLACDSKFIQDINKPTNPKNYEGAHVSVMQAVGDILVGFKNLCLKNSQEIPGANVTDTYKLETTDSLFFKYHDRQLKWTLTGSYPGYDRLRRQRPTTLDLPTSTEPIITEPTTAETVIEDITDAPTTPETTRMTTIESETTPEPIIVDPSTDAPVNDDDDNWTPVTKANRFSKNKKPAKIADESRESVPVAHYE